MVVTAYTVPSMAVLGGQGVCRTALPAGLMGRPPPTAAAAAPAPVPGPPEEREFVDDDGTRYVWDEREGRYVPAPAGPVPTYSVDDMVFQAEGTPADPVTPAGGPAPTVCQHAHVVALCWLSWRVPMSP